MDFGKRKEYTGQIPFDKSSGRSNQPSITRSTQSIWDCWASKSDSVTVIKSHARPFATVTIRNESINSGQECFCSNGIPILVPSKAVTETGIETADRSQSCLRRFEIPTGHLFGRSDHCQVKMTGEHGKNRRVGKFEKHSNVLFSTWFVPFVSLFLIRVRMVISQPSC